MPAPNFFIVGAPKCGTTTLYRALAGHPEVFMASIKEPHHFSGDLWHHHGGTMYRNLARREEYLRLFDAVTTEKVIGEASVHYLLSQVAPVAIRSFDPAARIVAMVRRPADFLHSLHRQCVNIGEERIEDFAEALDLTLQERQRRVGPLPPASRFLHGFDYRGYARFSEHLRRWMDVFPPEQIHVVVFDELLERPGVVFADVCRFLDIDAEFEPDLGNANPARVVRSSLLMNALWSQGRWKRLLAATMPARLQLWLYHRVGRLGTRVRSRAPMDPEMRRRLDAEFADEVDRLGTLLGRDLSHWATRVTVEGAASASERTGDR